MCTKAWVPLFFSILKDYFWAISWYQYSSIAYVDVLICPMLMLDLFDDVLSCIYSICVHFILS